MPAWTDRIMYATHADSPDEPQTSSITNVLYTTIPSYTTSDHVRALALTHSQRPVFTDISVYLS